MENILLARQKLRELYNSYSTYIDIIVRFAFVLSVLFLINSRLGYNELLLKWNIVVIIALISSLISWSGITFVVAGFATVHLFSLAIEAGAFFLAFALIAAVLHYLFLPGYSIVIVIIPFAFYFNVPYIIPVILGLTGHAASFIPAGIGVFSYYFLIGIERNAGMLAEGSLQLTDLLERCTEILNIISDNREMLVMMLTFCITALAVYAIRRLSVDYGPYIAVGAGILIQAAAYAIFGLSFELQSLNAETFIWMAVCIVPTALIAFLILAVDYSRTEYLQYEDDDYLYYVKAVPKVKLTAIERRKHEISGMDDAETEISQASPEEDMEISEAIKILDEIAGEEKKDGGRSV